MAAWVTDELWAEVAPLLPERRVTCRGGRPWSEDRAAFASIDPAVHYHRLQIADFINSIIEGRRPLVTGEDGRTVVAMFRAIYRSDRERRPIPFPLASEPSS